ncbi:ATP-dependent RNA helicase DBP3 like protein, variant 2 [Balamuthia mandrillaris]
MNPSAKAKKRKKSSAADPLGKLGAGLDAWQQQLTAFPTAVRAASSPRAAFLLHSAALGNALEAHQESCKQLQRRLHALTELYNFLTEHEVGAQQLSATQMKGGKRPPPPTPLEVYTRLLPYLMPRLEALLQEEGGSQECFVKSNANKTEVITKEGSNTNEVAAEGTMTMVPTSKGVAVARLLAEAVKVTNNGRCNESLLQDILSKPHWAKHPELVEPLINHSMNMNKHLAKWILASEQWGVKQQHDWIRRVLEEGNADRDVSKFVLSKPPFSEGQHEFKDIVLKRRLTKRCLGEKLSGDLKEGAVIKTFEHKLKIISCGGKGNTGAVYKATDQNGRIVGLKVCVKYEPEQIISMQRESKKMEYLADLNVVPFTAILEAGDDYVVKEWAEGITGQEWFSRWAADSDSSPKQQEAGKEQQKREPASTSDPSFRKLVALFRSVASKGIYLQNFKPQNLLWDEEKGDWVVIDYGGHKTVSDSDEVFAKYCDKFDRLWNKRKAVVPPLEELIRKMEQEMKEEKEGGGGKEALKKNRKKEKEQNGVSAVVSQENEERNKTREKQENGKEGKKSKRKRKGSQKKELQSDKSQSNKRKRKRKSIKEEGEKEQDENDDKRPKKKRKQENGETVIKKQKKTKKKKTKKQAGGTVKKKKKKTKKQDG